MGNTYGLLLEEVCSILVGTNFEVVDVLEVLYRRATDDAQQLEDTILKEMVQRCPTCERWVWKNPGDWNKYKGCCMRCTDLDD